MSVEILIANLLRVAREDLDGSRLLSARGNRNAIYLCEQAAEKILLAVLSSEGKHGNIKHQLDEMVKLIPDENPLKPMLQAMEDLGAFATTYRYPSPAGKIKPPPSMIEFDERSARVERAWNAAIDRFKVDISKPNTPAGTGAPIR